jgi:hypothetical protein
MLVLKIGISTSSQQLNDQWRERQKIKKKKKKKTTPEGESEIIDLYTYSGLTLAELIKAPPQQ